MVREGEDEDEEDVVEVKGRRDRMDTSGNEVDEEFDVAVEFDLDKGVGDGAGDVVSS